MFITSGQRGAVEGRPCPGAAAWGRRRGEAAAPAARREPALPALTQGNGESNRGRKMSGACGGTGNYEPFFSSALASMCEIPCISKAEMGGFNHSPVAGPAASLAGDRAERAAGLGPSPQHLGTRAAPGPTGAGDVPS